jgi:hypothetical protein
VGSGKLERMLPTGVPPLMTSTLGISELVGWSGADNDVIPSSVGTCHMQTSVAMQRLVERSSVVTNQQNDLLIIFPWQRLNAAMERHCVFCLVRLGITDLCEGGLEYL